LVVVNYPFHTDRRPPPVHVEMDPDLAAIVDGVTGDE
jgi:hypothetical protein